MITINIQIINVFSQPLFSLLLNKWQMGSSKDDVRPQGEGVDDFVAIERGSQKDVPK
jgi:hypothetical protein